MPFSPEIPAAFAAPHVVTADVSRFETGPVQGGQSHSPFYPVDRHADMNGVVQQAPHRGSHKQAAGCFLEGGEVRYDLQVDGPTEIRCIPQEAASLR